MCVQIKIVCFFRHFFHTLIIKNRTLRIFKYHCLHFKHIPYPELKTLVHLTVTAIHCILPPQQC